MPTQHFDFNAPRGHLFLASYDSDTNTVLDWGTEVEAWKESGELLVQVITNEHGTAVSDESGRVAWVDLDSKGNDWKKSVILFANIVGMRAAAEE